MNTNTMQYTDNVCHLFHVTGTKHLYCITTSDIFIHNIISVSTFIPFAENNSGSDSILILQIVLRSNIHSRAKEASKFSLSCN